MEALLTADFWIGIFKIIWIDVILSGDNAVVIALAARSLPPAQQRKAIILGAGFAIALRVALTVVASSLMQLPWVEIIGGALLLWIGVGLLQGDSPDESSTGPSGGSGSIFVAIRTILLADLVMCLDNVIAVAAAAQGSLTLLIFGLAVSIPLVVFGSTLMIRLMDRFPWIVPAGAGLIGWVAGETVASDHVLSSVAMQYPLLKYAAAACGAALVLAVGLGLKRRKAELTSSH
jgi:YjbE family integral membrane protein